MVDAPLRRAVLRSSAAVGVLSLAGCALDNPDVAGGHLFVENTLPAEYRVVLTVTQGADRDGEAVVDDVYRVPADHALQFEGVLEAGTTYTVTAYRPRAESEDRVTVTVPPCENEDAEGRDVSVRVRDDGTGIIPWGCANEEYTRLELEYVDPSGYTVEETETMAQ